MLDRRNHTCNPLLTVDAAVVMRQVTVDKTGLCRHSIYFPRVVLVSLAAEAEQGRTNKISICILCSKEEENQEDHKTMADRSSLRRLCISSLERKVMERLSVSDLRSVKFRG